MKKLVLISALAISAFVSVPAVYAQNPTSVILTVTCPATQGQNNVLSNFGT
jgi:hypothetical protein